MKSIQNTRKYLSLPNHNSTMNNPNQHISPQVQGTTLRDIPYTFSGKEKDQETGYVPKAFGIGARYYSSDLSVWLSVDPLSDRYPHESPYCYAGLNPVMITDPNGMWKDPTKSKKSQEETTAKYRASGVGKVYNANAGTVEESDYRFNVYKVGEDKYVHKTENGNWYNPNTGESLRPDLNHPNPIGTHWDCRSPAGKWYRIFPNETVSPKI